MKTITLSKAIKVEGEEVKELTFTEPTLGDLQGLKLEFSMFDDLVPLIAKTANIPPSSAKQIAAKDIFKIMEIIKDFLGFSTVSENA